MERIVVGVDGSEQGEDALRWAIAEARLRRCPVHVVHAYDVPVYGNLMPGFTTGVPEDLLVEQAQGILASSVGAVVDEQTAGELHLTREVLRGHPADMLIAAGRSAALLVLGARGRGGFLGVRLGSVTNHVVHHAPCPVVVVPAAEAQ